MPRITMAHSLGVGLHMTSDTEPCYIILSYFIECQLITELTGGTEMLAFVGSGLCVDISKCSAIVLGPRR